MMMMMMAMTKTTAMLTQGYISNTNLYSFINK